MSADLPAIMMVTSRARSRERAYLGITAQTQIWMLRTHLLLPQNAVKRVQPLHHPTSASSFHLPKI
jgi:hypothetical protein